MNYQLTKNNLHIEDSYLVSKKDMNEVLATIHHEDVAVHDVIGSSNVWYRAYESLIAEWVCHNFLYSVGLWRSRTKDVDLDFPCDKLKWVYALLSVIVYPFVK